MGGRRVGRWPNRRLYRQALVLALGVFALALVSCLPTVLSTEQTYLLARSDGALWRVLPDDDETYATFSTEVLGDPYLSQLLGVYDGATKALLAERLADRLPQTASNMPVILLDSAWSGAVRDVRLGRSGEHVNIELALGLGNDGREDQSWAKQRLAWVIGMGLYELMGQAPASVGGSWASPYEATTPARALQEGLALALDAAHARANPTLIDGIAFRSDLSIALRDRLDLGGLVEGNRFRFEFSRREPTSVLRTYTRALSTSGVCATFFHRLLRETGSGYPQRLMLWFANFQPADVPYAKALVALAHMPPNRASLEAFVASYGESFPAEKEWVSDLFRQVVVDPPMQDVSSAAGAAR